MGFGGRGGFRKGKKKPKREGVFNLPNPDEIAKLEKDLAKHMSKLDEQGNTLKKMTQAQMMSIIRGAVRDKWSYADVKLAYLLKGVEPDHNPNTRRRFKVTCEKCKEDFSKGDIQIDHVVGEHSLKSIEDFHSFVESILYVNFDGLRRLCVPCHDLVTAMERYSLSEEEAILFKQMTAWEAANDTAERKQWLMDKGFKSSEVSNHDKRRECYLNYLRELHAEKKGS